MNVSGVNARMVIGWGRLAIATGVNACATNTRVAREKVNTTQRFNTEMIEQSTGQIKKSNVTPLLAVINRIIQVKKPETSKKLKTQTFVRIH